MGEYEHDMAQGIILESFIWYQKDRFDKSSVLSKKLYSGLSSLLIY